MKILDLKIELNSNQKKLILFFMLGVAISIFKQFAIASTDAEKFKNSGGEYNSEDPQAQFNEQQEQSHGFSTPSGPYQHELVDGTGTNKVVTSACACQVNPEGQITSPSDHPSIHGFGVANTGNYGGSGNNSDSSGPSGGNNKGNR